MTEKELLERIWDAQVVLFKKLDDVERKLNGGSRSAPLTSYEKDLVKEVLQLREQRKSII